MVEAGEAIPNAFDAVVFAGGGCRCFWQAGFWREASSSLSRAPERVAAVSAGAAFACAALANIGDRVVDEFATRIAANPRNLYPGNALRGRPVFPHEGMYRETVLACVDRAALDRLRAGPEIRVLMAHPPYERGVHASLLAGLLAYQLERAVRRRVHTSWPGRLGFRPSTARVQDCANPEELADLLLHSSCTPPVTPLFRRAGRLVVDGGLIDGVPVHLVAEADSTLVLLTRRYPAAELPSVPGRVYVQPSQPIAVKKWDYTDAAGVRAAYDLGRRDGERFAAQLER